MSLCYTFTKETNCKAQTRTVKDCAWHSGGGASGKCDLSDERKKCTKYMPTGLLRTKDECKSPCYWRHSESSTGHGSQGELECSAYKN